MYSKKWITSFAFIIHFPKPCGSGSSGNNEEYNATRPLTHWLRHLGTISSIQPMICMFLGRWVIVGVNLKSHLRTVCTQLNGPNYTKTETIVKCLKSGELNLHVLWHPHCVLYCLNRIVFNLISTWIPDWSSSKFWILTLVQKNLIADRVYYWTKVIFKSNETDTETE